MEVETVGGSTVNGSLRYRKMLCNLALWDDRVETKLLAVESYPRLQPSTFSPGAAPVSC